MCGGTAGSKKQTVGAENRTGQAAVRKACRDIDGTAGSRAQKEKKLSYQKQEEKEMAVKALRMVKYGTCTVWRQQAIIKDEKGLPNFMTVFFMDPKDGTPDEKDIPEIFKVDGKIMQGVAISQYHNTNIKGVPCSLPYAMPWEGMSLEKGVEAVEKKGAGWHLLTNTEFVYLLNEAKKIGHEIHGNTDYGKCADAPEEQGILYDGYCTLTGCEPLPWSHDGTEDGVFGLCGNYWEPVTGLRLREGVIEYIPENDAAVVDTGKSSEAWKVAEIGGKALKLSAIIGGVGVKLTTKEAERVWNCCHMRDLVTEEFETIPDIIFKLGILPENWQERKDGIWVDSDLTEATPLRGSSFLSTSNGGPAALYLYDTRAGSSSYVSLRSALLLESWELVTDALAGA